MRARSITLLAVAIVVLFSSASAAPPTAEQVIRTGIDDVLAVLRDPATRSADARAKRVARLHEVADRFFDWPEMSRRSLGPTWRTLDASQRQRFAALFPDLLADAYIDDLDRFRGDERVSIERSTESRDQAEVRTIVVTHGGEKVPMVYWLHRVDSAWQVYDFSIEGISLVNNYRESFARFLVNHDFEALMQRLERKRATIAPAAN
ncbi:MAG: phospholipid-binding protein MlaC [Kofleriaceae bacterium]